MKTIRKIGPHLFDLKSAGIFYKDQRNALLIRKSHLFDAPWYLSQNTDVAMAGIDPALHYARHGAYEGRNPSPFFDSLGYIAANPDVGAAHLNPLVHYIKWGRKERRPTGSPPVTQFGTPITPTIALDRTPDFRPDNELVGSFEQFTSSYPSPRNKTGRIVVFASYSADSAIHPYVVYYLQSLRKISDTIIFVADNKFPDDELAKLTGIVDAHICERHEEYDFGSYKRGIVYANERGILSDADELLLCNDSCYGPVYDFDKLFEEMSTRKCDFWGLTDNSQFSYHLQSYFVVFKKNVFSSQAFIKFFSAIKKEKSVSDVILNYEVVMTSYFRDLGLTSSCYTDDGGDVIDEARRLNPNLTVFPNLLLEVGCPLLKVKAFKKTAANYDGIGAFLRKIHSVNPELYTYIIEHSHPSRFFEADGVRFSIITPFYNRKSSIFRSIDSVLGQRHAIYELILVDDGSTDGAYDAIIERYSDEMSGGKIKLIRSNERTGVSAARNAGLAKASGPWIAYLDSDNCLKPNFLSTFASSIIEHPNHRLFYSCFENQSDGVVRGRRPFNRPALLKANYIDLGAFVHSRDMFRNLGGFDTTMRRLVDWDLIIRYTEKAPAVFIPHPLMIYNDAATDKSRISVSESLDDARVYLRGKHGMPITITTIVPAYNHESYISQALDSAIKQAGDFIHEIIVCDDGSSDRTRDIVKGYVQKHRHLVRDVSNDENLGISSTFRKCIDNAAGDFIAILEGDDYWSSPDKLQKQLKFLMDNPDCSMVFSMIDVVNTQNGTKRLLNRQKVLTRSKLTGSDFLNDPSMNLIANFSSCLFKSGLMKSLPDRLFEGRFNEIALAFQLEKSGAIGFIQEVLSVYRQHPQGVWTGSDKRRQLESAIQARHMVKDVAAPAYHDRIQSVIDQKSSELTELDIRDPLGS
ncbi:glycosyltransferase [Mesorhizobium sp. M0938]|uniref:glycosyltransferase n=1 Tax=unclassified Mesorhizobium TaxID=325217 RepID=UPI00333939F1